MFTRVFAGHFPAGDPASGSHNRYFGAQTAAILKYPQLTDYYGPLV